MQPNAFIEHKECHGCKKKITGLIEKAFFVGDCSGIGDRTLKLVNAGMTRSLR
jgi:hypothetical protein